MNKSATKLVRVGFIQKSHGNKGQVLVNLESSSLSLKDNLYKVWLGENPGHTNPWNIEKYRQQGETVYLKLREINSIEEADFLKGLQVYFTEKSFQEPPIQSLKGYQLYSEQGHAFLGEILESDMSNIQPAFIIKTLQGDKLQIPAVQELIVSIDHENGRVYYNKLKGLFGED
ncbi:MAG TPA: hypothetical protein VKP78_11025 [bacterium]|nr:hypothetical protein [bacterium]